LSSSCVPDVASFSGLFLFCLSSSNKNNPEKLATSDTQDEDKENKNNPEKLATSGTQDEDKENKNNPEKLAT
jgi:hypothetical protein